MGKLLLYGIVFSLIALVFYLVSFLVYMLLALKTVFVSLGIPFSLPYEGTLILFKNLASEFFYLLFPILTIIAVSNLVILTKLRSPKFSGLRYDPILYPKVSVALTAWNDEEPIYEAVRDFKDQEGIIEVIVVDNNSSDNTVLLAKQAGARVVVEKNPGYGYVCIRGLREALSNKEANVIVLTEGDRTFRGYDIKKLIPYLDNADLVLGTRTTQELLDQKSQLDWFLVWGNLFLAKLIQLKYWSIKCWGRVRLTDVGCTYRAIRREALEKIIDRLEAKGIYFSPHMIMVALNNNLKVVEVPITFRERVGMSKGAGGSRWRATKIGLKMLWHIMTY